MLKLPLALLVSLATCSAQNVHPLVELQGTSRVLIVFAPDSSSAGFKRQLELIEHHGYELTERNTVVMPVSLANAATADPFAGENLPLSTSSDQADARIRFHIQPGEFVVVLLNLDGSEQGRYAAPLDIHELTAKLDSMPRH
jgi:hypothetical protein